MKRIKKEELARKRQLYKEEADALKKQIDETRELKEKEKLERQKGSFLNVGEKERPKGKIIRKVVRKKPQPK